jgi:alkanesulfonate monooxygenase SsuD/methylene tetrahydromethanopterin reductase-like flavin-dependent oxidoreductase (luciferase family)
VKFGLHLFGHHDASTPADENFRTVLEQVRTAERVGFDLLWTGHHYMLADRQKFQVLPALARLAADAGDMHLGTTYLLPLHHPVLVAEQFATLDAITGGRTIFAPVAGYRDREFDATGVPKRHRIGRLVEGVEIIDALWREDGVSFEGRHFAFEDVTITPKPVQDPRPPIWVGAHGDEAVRRAATLGDTWLANPHADEPTIRRQLSLLDEPDGEGYRGVRPGRRDVFVAETDRDALETFGPHIESFYDWYTAEGQAEVMKNPNALDARFDDLREERFVVGSPDTVADRLVELHDTVGLDCVLMGMHRPGLPHEATLRSIELAGEEVLPAVRDRVE